MKKLISLIILVFFYNLLIQAENKSIKDTLSITSNQTDPWVKEVGLRYFMPILVRVYNNSTLFQPTGALLGIFKDNKCWGYAGIGNSPVGPIFNVTIGYNDESATGFNYKLYVPTTKLTYDIIETVNFQDGVPIGQIQAPVSINISGLSALDEVKESELMIFPNPVKTEFTINLFNSNSSNNVIVKLISTNGQLISILYNGAFKNSIRVQRESSLLNGVYFLQVFVNSTVFTQKLILN